MILGDNLILAINGTPLAASKSCSISKSQSFIEVSSPTSGRWQSFVPKQLGWDISSDCLIGTMDAYKTLDAAWKNGTALTVRFYDREYNENETGTAYIENLDLTATNGNLAKMSVSLNGSGPLNEYGGTAIALTFQEGTRNGYYWVYNEHAIFANNYQVHGQVNAYKFTLSKRSKVRLNMTACRCAIFSQDANILDDLGNESNFTLQSRNAQAYNNSTDIMLGAGVWYVLFSSDDEQSMQYSLTNMS